MNSLRKKPEKPRTTTVLDFFENFMGEKLRNGCTKTNQLFSGLVKTNSLKFILELIYLLNKKESSKT